MDRFDLEQEILEAWRVTNDLELLTKENAVNDENIKAVITLCELRFNRLWNTFEQLIREDKFK